MAMFEASAMLSTGFFRIKGPISIDFWDMPWPDGRGSPVSIDDCFSRRMTPRESPMGHKTPMIPFLQGQDEFDIIVIVFFWLHHIKTYLKMMSKS